jgi:diguanylate cyclase (GGDEF)-like protein
MRRWCAHAGAGGTMRMRWTMVSLGFALGVLSFVLMLYRGFVEAAPSGMAGIQDVMLLLRGIPFLIAISMSKRERSPVFVRLDLAQVGLAVGIAFIAFLFAFPAPGGGYVPVSPGLAVDRLAIANVLFATAATLRIFSRGSGEERRFFRLMCGFLWANGLLTTFVNLVVIQRWQVPAGAAVLALGDVPVLVFAALVSLPAVAGTTERATATGTLLESGSSFLFPFFIFLMAASIVPMHLELGIACLGLTFILYAVRAAILQTKLIRVQDELRRTNDRTRDEAMLDGLTGIPNRRAFDLTLEREWRRAQRTGQPLSLLLLDIDYFKMLNDTYGHLAGDGCLMSLARLLRSHLAREVDFAARYGGEEFAILLANTGLAGARTVAEKLRRAIAEHLCLEEKGRRAQAVTASIGVASVAPVPPTAGRGLERSMLIAAADEALYRAKKMGRNRVEVFTGRLDGGVEPGRTLVGDAEEMSTP